MAKMTNGLIAFGVVGALAAAALTITLGVVSAGAQTTRDTEHRLRPGRLGVLGIAFFVVSARRHPGREEVVRREDAADDRGVRDAEEATPSE